jgi:hypothetical protein
VVFPHTTPDGHLVNLYGRAVVTAEQVPKALRHDHLPGAKGYFNATALQAGPGPLWVCEGDLQKQLADFERSIKPMGDVLPLGQLICMALRYTSDQKGYPQPALQSL